MAKTITFEVDAKRLAQAVSNKTRKQTISPSHAEAFLEIFEEEIRDELANAFLRVVARHFSAITQQ
jgi:hypothetical protein